MSDDLKVGERLFADFRDDLLRKLKFVGVQHQHMLLGDMKDSLLWHFTRLSALKCIITNREIWLSDLTQSNDVDEMRFGARNIVNDIEHTTKLWGNRNHAKSVKQFASNTMKLSRFKQHIFGFCLTDERDLVHHWGAYGGGLQVVPSEADPYVAIGFEARALAYPLNFCTVQDPAVFLFNLVYGEDAAKTLGNYWAIKMRKALELLERGKTGFSNSGFDWLAVRSLFLVCALVKSAPWSGESEYRLIYLPDQNQTPLGNSRLRPDKHGRYFSLSWTPESSPIRAVMPHPLAKFHEINRRVERICEGERSMMVLRSELKPRAK